MPFGACKSIAHWLRNSLKQHTVVGGMLHREFFKNLKTNFILLKVLLKNFSNELTKKKKVIGKEIH